MGYQHSPQGRQMEVADGIDALVRAQRAKLVKVVAPRSVGTPSLRASPSWGSAPKATRTRWAVVKRSQYGRPYCGPPPLTAGGRAAPVPAMDVEAAG
ncbi:hypothetical protein ACFYN0_14095 [Streptomyces sp. NPDC006704]|uniref:hypothetical protein n=1 Tax=Streptomyces sp. NPDC006704 TaxID=3364760 RepID=UPI0036BE85BF